MDFKRIDLHAKNLIAGQLCRTKYVDLGFVSLFYTADAFDMCYAFFEGELVLRILDGDFAYVAPAHTCLKLAQKFGFSRFEYIAQDDVEIFKSAGAKVCLDERFSDYLCDYSEYISIKKSSAPGKYKDYNQFLKKHDAEVLELELSNLCVALKILESWCEGRDCSACAYGCEKKWILKLFDAWEDLPVRGFLLRVDGKFCAFNIAEQNAQTLLKLVAKPAGTPNGAMVYFGIQSAMRFEGVNFVNLGADSGVAGLISFKSKFKPFDKLHKYSALFS